MLKLKKMTVTDAEAVTNNALPNEINTTLHTSNAATAPDTASATAENKTSVRRLLDGLEYPVAKGGIITKVFGHKSDADICVA